MHIKYLLQFICGFNYDEMAIEPGNLVHYRHEVHKYYPGGNTKEC